MRPSCSLSTSKRILTPSHLPLASLPSHRHPFCFLVFQLHSACQGMMPFPLSNVPLPHGCNRGPSHTPSLSALWTPWRMILLLSPVRPHPPPVHLLDRCCSPSSLPRWLAGSAVGGSDPKPFRLQSTSLTTTLGTRSTAPQPLSLLHLLVECWT